MGVRFECPAGHKLHVKAELAGKRGICPECGAKFIVPSFSGERVAEDNGAATTSTVVVNSHAASTVTPPPVPGARPALAPPPEPTAWYIRPASGGQFGPANDEAFAQWIAEGRVSADSWVWRNGWADWKAGGDAIREFNSRPPVASIPAPPPIAEDVADEFEDEPTIDVDFTRPAPAVVAAPIEVSPADQRRAEIKRRKQQVRNLSILLGIIALLMLVVLIFVLARGSGEETPAEEEQPAAAVPAAPVEEPPAEEPPAEAPSDEPVSE
ncbi:MAG: hypothetical protein C0485_01555 [Pirellula sp.]|nr:hypothetical protein [Pirellula sp.]